MDYIVVILIWRMALFWKKKKRKEEAPVCVACDTIITIKYIWIECADLVEVRKNILRRDLCIIVLYACAARVNRLWE